MTASSELGAWWQTAPPGTGWTAGQGRILDSPVLLSIPERVLLHGPPAEGLSSHRARFGASGRPEVQQLLRDLDDSRLTGRGGGHFPVARKWRTTLAADRSRLGAPVVVANAAEGEPFSAKDAALLALRPHLVLDGLAVAAATVGAEHAVLWLHSNASGLHDIVDRALAERRSSAPDRVPVEVLSGPHGYLTGESSAVVRALGGGPAAPAFLRTPSATSGVHGRPTLVHNAETLARVALVARGGAGAGAVRTTGWGPLLSVLTPSGIVVVDAEARWTLAEVTAAAARVDGRVEGAAEAPVAVLIGGFGGRWARWDDVSTRPVDDLLGTGPRGLGVGVVATLPDGACGLRETAAVLEYLASSSAGQCGPCVHGTRELADRMAALAEGRARRSDLDRLLGVASMIDGRGACGLPDGAALLAHTALQVFAHDATQHARRRPCRDVRAVLPVPAVPAAAGGR